MSRLLCCVCARQPDMGAALSLPHDAGAGAGAGVGVGEEEPPTMADVIRERKKKAGGAALGTLRRRLAAAARRPRENRPDRGCEHARFIRSVVSSWRLAEVFLLCEELEAGAALRDLVTQAELAREPARALHADLAALYKERWWCDVELVGSGWSIGAHRAILHARCTYFRDLLQRYPPSPSCWRVPLEGAGAALSREQLEACVLALYAGPAAATHPHPHPARTRCAEYERGVNSDGDLDIINMDNNTCSCGRGHVDASTLRRLSALLGFSLDTLHQDMRYLLDSGELADGRLEFRLFGGGGAAYGFRTALALPCHRLLLAARSRYFRSVMSRRTGVGAGAGGAGVGVGVGAGAAVCVDECVLPRRFASALLHAAYTDQVDLSLIGRNSSSPSSTNSGGSGTTVWPGVARGGGGGGSARPLSAAALADAFQLYEIARFLEMPIVVQGCEDAIVEALTPESLPHVLRWAGAPHASAWVRRQALRYLRDDFPAVMQHAAAPRLARAALADALASPFLQAGEGQVLRALLRWGAEQPAERREPNLVWHTQPARRAARRREPADAALRDTLASLVALVRLEHLPPDTELLHQLVRRGVVPAPAEGAGGAGAWLGRGPHRPPRCFLPYLDEVKALLAGQPPPEAELARARRDRCLHRIPDTLYMVAAARGAAGAGAGGAGGAGGECARACVSPRVLHALTRRARELRAAPPAARALQLHNIDTAAVYRQIALRAVREMSLPDSCAELLLADLEHDRDRSREGSEWEAGGERWPDDRSATDCCRAGGGSLRCAGAGSSRAAPLHIPMDNSRAGACRRESSVRALDTAQHRQSAGVSGAGVGAGAGGRLSACVPDVAMAPNANTHLLTARDYFRHAPPFEYAGGGGGGGGGGLQLDLGDGATHTPRPGSRAQRAGSAHGGRQHRDHTQAMSCLRSRADEEELRAAIELSVIRAYSSFGARGAATLPHASHASHVSLAQHASRADRHAQHTQHTLGGSRGRSSASPGPPSGGSGGGGGSGGRGELHTPPLPPPPPHLPLSRLSSAGASAPVAPSRSPSPGASPSPRRFDACVYRPNTYRLEPGYGSSGSGSRGHSPNNYA